MAFDFVEAGAKGRRAYMKATIGATVSGILALFALVAIVLPAQSQPIETAAEYVHMIDQETGTVLLSKNADQPFPPASMAKLMTLAVVFQAIEEGELRLDEEFHISENAWRTGGAPSRTATMFAAVNSRVALSDLLRGIMVQAANDACIAIAEGIAGSEAAFAVAMNDRAAELGLTQSVFVNSTGLPAEGQQTTARDLVRLARHLIEDYPDLYAIFAEPEFTWNGIRQLNRNPLAASNIGADGLMAGSDEQTGFGMIASAIQNNQRTIIALHGMPTANARVGEVQKLLMWGSRAFDRLSLFDSGEAVGEVGVYGGEPGRVALSSSTPIEVMVPKGGRANLRGRIVYTGPLKAPVQEGDRVGVLRVQNEESVISEVPLYASHGVGVAPLHQRALDAAWELVVGVVHSGVEAATSR